MYANRQHDRKREDVTVRQSESPTNPSKNTRFQRVFFQSVVPVIFLFISVGTTCFVGNFVAENIPIPPYYVFLAFPGDRDVLLSQFWQGLPFAGTILLCVGAHAFGHFLAARHHQIPVSFPYYVPTFGIAGTWGAYIKLSWPIMNRQTLLHIFTIGPIAGFCVSWFCFVIGILLSDAGEGIPSHGSFILGTSFIVSLTERAIAGIRPETLNIVLHPVGVAGWIGLHYNMLHILPIGKLDGGRIIYALWGYRMMKLISLLTIFILLMYAYVWPGWIGIALFGILSMIGLRSQYATERSPDKLVPLSYYLSGSVFLILLLSFVPVPLISTFSGR
jgi:membrane-associated protease RseP (regulator of RpoE activity)